MHCSNGFSEQLMECLKLGLLHVPSGRFLTAEVFNNEINISGTALRKRQIWTLYTCPGDRSDLVFLQNHLGRFLSVNKDGKISAVCKPAVEECFLMEFSPDTGAWAFRSNAHNFYLTGSDTQISCFSKTPSWWSIRLAIHPVVHIRHQFRSRYLRIFADGCEVRADQPYPWGLECLICLEQPPMTVNSTASRGLVSPVVGHSAVARLGRVAFKILQNGKYLKSDGELSEVMDDSVLFSLEIRPGSPCLFAFRDQNGAYLTAIGPGTTKTKMNSTTVGKEELFLVERAALEIGILAHNGKFASVKQGVEISANQHELDETATFHLEYVGGKGFNFLDIVPACPSFVALPGSDGDCIDMIGGDKIGNGVIANGLKSDVYCLITGFWRLRSRSGKLWKLAASSAVKNVAADDDKDSLFEILTVDKTFDNTCQHIVLRTNCGQSLTARKLGAISSGRSVEDNTTPAPDELFRIVLVNRVSLVFISSLTGAFLTRGKQATMDCLGVMCEQFELHITKRHTYQIFARSPNSDAYCLWTAAADGLLQLEPTLRTPNEEVAVENLNAKQEFIFHFLGYGRIIIQTMGCSMVDGTSPSYIKAEVKGEVKHEVPFNGDIITNYIWEI